MSLLESHIPILENETFIFYNQTLVLKEMVSSDVSVYNNLTNKITESKQTLNNVKNGNLQLLINENMPGQYQKRNSVMGVLAKTFANVKKLPL